MTKSQAGDARLGGNPDRASLGSPDSPQPRGVHPIEGVVGPSRPVFVPVKLSG